MFKILNAYKVPPNPPNHHYSHATQRIKLYLSPDGETDIVFQINMGVLQGENFP